MWTGGPRLSWKQKGSHADELCEVVEEFVKIKRLSMFFTDGEVEVLHDEILNKLPL